MNPFTITSDIIRLTLGLFLYLSFTNPIITFIGTALIIIATVNLILFHGLLPHLAPKTSVSLNEVNNEILKTITFKEKA